MKNHCSRIVVHAKTECTGLTAKQIKALRATDNLEWTCNDCKKDGSRRGSFRIHDEEDSEPEEEAVKTPQKVVNVDTEVFMARITKEINKIVKKDITPINTALKFLDDKFEECLENKKYFKQKIRELEKKNSELTNKNNNMELRLAAMEQKITSYEQNKLEEAIEIAGIPHKNDENLAEITKSVANVIGMQSEQARNVTRLPSRSEKTGTILLKMQDKESKSMWLSAARNKKIMLKDVIPTIDETIANNTLYVREALTGHLKTLLWKAKQELKPLFKFVWCRDGVVKARKEEKTKIYNIFTAEDIIKIKNLS
ncbi:hypothetical protein NE865_16438 [Phthorimaea operculella]|nr:hypothetical protein NE865_16438 [Phthorimaea operculella]